MSKMENRILGTIEACKRGQVTDCDANNEELTILDAREGSNVPNGPAAGSNRKVYHQRRRAELRGFGVQLG